MTIMYAFHRHDSFAFRTTIQTHMNRKYKTVVYVAPFSLISLILNNNACI